MNKTQLSVTLNFLKYFQENINNCIEYLNIFDEKKKKDSLTLHRIFSNNNTSIIPFVFIFQQYCMYLLVFLRLQLSINSVISYRVFTY